MVDRRFYDEGQIGKGSKGRKVFEFGVYEPLHYILRQLGSTEISQWSPEQVLTVAVDLNKTTVCAFLIK